MQKTLNNYINSLITQGNYSPHTVSAYTCDLKKWLDYAQQKQVNTWQELDAGLIKTHIISLHSKGILVATMRRRLASLRAFMDYLVNTGQLAQNPATHIKTPKLKQALPKVISYEQTMSLLKPNATKINDLRDNAMIAIFYACAIRLSELTGLNIKDIDINNQHIKVLGKGAKERFVPTGGLAVSYVEQYLAKRVDDNPALFVSHLNHKNPNPQRISNRAVQILLKNRAISTGLESHLHPHMLRHSAASHFLQSSGDLSSVQKFLGHKDITSTQRYTHLDYLAIAKVYDECHPRSKVVKK